MKHGKQFKPKFIVLLIVSDQELANHPEPVFIQSLHQEGLLSLTVLKYSRKEGKEGGRASKSIKERKKNM